jgi:WD40 repeat protein
MATLSATLSGLPNEILSLVSSHLDRPKDVLNLALSSRRLNDYTKLDGWKAFLKGRFGLSGLDADAQNAVHGLTTLYRNWDRKAFLARHLEPAPKMLSLNSWEERRWRGPRGQTMGYQPKIDSYEEMRGGWTDRREVLAWSAGTSVLMRVKETGKKAERLWEDRKHMEKTNENLETFDDFRHLNEWYMYRIPESSEGRDDITAMKLLRPHQRDADCDGIAVGSASGHLSLLRIDKERQQTTEQSCFTDGRMVGSLSISAASNPLMAANLGDASVALYPLDLNSGLEEPLQPLSQVTPIVSGARNGRLWSCQFLSDKTVAVGLGPSYDPIQIYEVTPHGFNAEPIRKFSLDSKFWGGVRENSGQLSTSIYPILPVPTDAQGGSEGGNVFLSGGYDGIIRLHDMRSPRSFETMFWDVTNDSSIYSLAFQGLERVVAGTSMHSMLKVFDLRLSGSHSYHYISVPSSKPAGNTTPAPKSQDITFNPRVKSTGSPPTTGGWNLYLNPRNPRQPARQRTADSPIYSLSIPSPTSPMLYAGIEGSITSLSFLSVTDPYPDTHLSSNVSRFPDTGLIDIKKTYNQSDDVLNLGMYEQGNEDGLGMQLMVQEGVGPAPRPPVDERWKDPSEESERWTRGQEPEVLRGGGQRDNGRGGRGGRGRGHRGHQRGGRGVLPVGRGRGRGQ